MNARQYSLFSILSVFLTVAVFVELMGAGSAHAGAADPRHMVTLYSEALSLDRKYASMEGPSFVQRVYIASQPEPELLWLTAIDVSVVDGDDDAKMMPAELICHSNLVLFSEARLEYGWQDRNRSRVFTLSQGQASIRVPDGFGLPIRSDEALILESMALNPYDEYIGSDVRTKTTLTFIREAERTAPITPLRMRYVQAYVSIDEAPRYFRVESHEEHFIPNETFVPITGSAAEGFPEVTKGKDAGGHSVTHGITTELGERLSDHWIVPPGRSEVRTMVNFMIGSTGDLNVHYISGHLHPYASSIEIRDMTTDSSVFRSSIEWTPDDKALKKIQNFSGDEPLTLHADHDYELVSIYNNTSDADVTAMAVMYLFAVDNDFNAARLMQW